MFKPATEFTRETAAQQLVAGVAAIDAGQLDFSFEGTGSIDSSAVACLLAWKRHAAQRHIKLAFHRLPDNLTHLIKLYGVEDLIQR